jgi:hypothetical protein
MATNLTRTIMQTIHKTSTDSMPEAAKVEDGHFIPLRFSGEAQGIPSCLAPAAIAAESSSGVTLAFNFTHALDEPCQVCHWLDSRGSVQVTDNENVTKAVCHDCAVNLVRACLPDGQFVSHDASAAPAFCAETASHEQVPATRAGFHASDQGRNAL